MDPSEKTLQKPFKLVSGIVTIVISIAIIAAGLLGKQYLEDNKVEATKLDVKTYTPTVEIQLAESVDFVPTINLQGEVMPATQTDIISEVNGALVELSDDLEVGEIIDEGEIIARVNSADYLTQLATAKSSLADAQLTLAQEKARAAQSVRDWNKLGRGKPASDLVRRVPQINSAQARIDSANAMIAKANRDVKKTIIRAPYRCLVDEKFIDKGAYISAMTKIARVYSVEDYEVRLPVSLDKVNFLPAGNGVNAEVKLRSSIGGAELTWAGKVTRFEGGIDSKTFSMIMVVKVSSNKDQGIFKYPPKGLFIDAEIKGRVLTDVIKIPRIALHEGNKIWILDKQNKLHMLDAIVVREERSTLYIKSKLKQGAQLITSPIAVPVEGMLLTPTKPKANNPLKSLEAKQS